MQGDNLSVDGSFVDANANKGSRIPREQFAEAARVNQIVRQYLVEVEQQNPAEETVHQQEQVSTDEPYMPLVKWLRLPKIGQVLISSVDIKC